MINWMSLHQYETKVLDIEAISEDQVDFKEDLRMSAKLNDFAR